MNLSSRSDEQNLGQMGIQLNRHLDGQPPRTKEHPFLCHRNPQRVLRPCRRLVRQQASRFLSCCATRRHHTRGRAFLASHRCKEGGGHLPGTGIPAAINYKASCSQATGQRRRPCLLFRVSAAPVILWTGNCKAKAHRYQRTGSQAISPACRNRRTWPAEFTMHYPKRYPSIEHAVLK